PVGASPIVAAAAWTRSPRRWRGEAPARAPDLDSAGQMAPPLQSSGHLVVEPLMGMDSRCAASIRRLVMLGTRGGSYCPARATLARAALVDRECPKRVGGRVRELRIEQR